MGTFQTPPRSGADTLRLIVNGMNYCLESFNDRFTAEELVAIGKAYITCGWDILPDTWEERQVQEALQGKPPRWDDDEKPVYDDLPAPPTRAAIPAEACRRVPGLLKTT